VDVANKALDISHLRAVRFMLPDKKTDTLFAAGYFE
jgi:hypothetical protein